jgi:hypothetical protein
MFVVVKVKDPTEDGMCGILGDYAKIQVLILAYDILKL